MRADRSRRNRYGNVTGQAHGALLIVLTALSMYAFSGCAPVGPDYVRVEPDVPEQWHTEAGGGLVSDRPSLKTLARWWNSLEDPELSSLEERAVKGNLSLKEARARVREARALRGIEKASLFPALNVSGSMKDYRDSENSRMYDQGTLYAAGFDAGWELDVFGGVRRSVEAAQAGLEATQEDLHDVLVSLLAEVALNYVDVRTYQARLAAAEGNIKAQEETYELSLSRYHAGLIDRLAVEQAGYNLERGRSQIPPLQTGLEGAKNRLAVLLGEKPGSLHQELSENRPIPVPPVAVAVGVPAETLRQRPDVRRAERNLAAQTARIGVATADLYPKLRLSGTIGLESVSSGDLLEWASRTWTIGPSASWNIFDAGAIRRNIEVQTTRQEQALIRYESVVLSALEEVENVLVAYAEEKRRRESLAAASASAERADLLARDQYEAGLVDFIDVLDAQRALLSLQDELAQSDGAAVSNLIRLYKALGGGWVSAELPVDESNHASD
jgi:NodT family efflux transporter outer membrane factor (OMF) lipoprotein